MSYLHTLHLPTFGSQYLTYEYKGDSDVQCLPYYDVNHS